MRQLIAVVALLAVVVFVSASAQIVRGPLYQIPPGVVKLVSPSYGPNDNCSAVAIARGLFLTSYHCLGPDLFIVDPADPSLIVPAEIIGSNSGYDLGALSAPLPVQPIGIGDPPNLVPGAMESRVSIVGYADNLPMPSIFRGTILSLRDETYFQQDGIYFDVFGVTALPGMLGGAVLDSDGRLISIIVDIPDQTVTLGSLYEGLRSALARFGGPTSRGESGGVR